MRRLALGILALVLVGCGRGDTPQDAARDYARAVRHDDPGLALSLSSEALRERTSEDRFAADFQRRVDAGDSLVEGLRHAADSDASLTASLPYSEYEKLELAFIDGRWRIVGGVAEFFGQRTPRAALVTFIRAVEAGDTQVLLAVVPAEYRSRIDASDLDEWLDRRADELAETLALLRSSLDAEIPEHDGRAVFRYGAREMEFVREDGRWVIADFE